MEGFFFFMAIIATWICCGLYDDQDYLPWAVTLALIIAISILVIGITNSLVNVENSAVYSFIMLAVPVLMIVAMIPIELYKDAKYERLAKLEEQEFAKERNARIDSIINCKYRFVEDESIYCCKNSTTIKTTQRSCEVCKNV